MIEFPIENKKKGLLYFKFLVFSFKHQILPIQYAKFYILLTWRDIKFITGTQYVDIKFTTSTQYVDNLNHQSSAYIHILQIKQLYADYIYRSVIDLILGIYYTDLILTPCLTHGLW